MWKQMSFLYCCGYFGMYCLTISPITYAASHTMTVAIQIMCPLVSLSQKLQARKRTEKTGKLHMPMKFSSFKELHFWSSEVSNNENFKNTEFKKLVQPLLIPRLPDTENSTLVQQYITNHFKTLKWHIKEDKFTDKTPYGKKSFTNIIVTFEPKVKHKLVLSCHYDSKNISDSRGNFFVAATDSAVPCAILMDVAQKLDCTLRKKTADKKMSLAEDVTLQMMFFDGEEAYLDWTATDSLYGSRHLAKWLKDETDPNYPGTKYIDNISLFVLLDLIGSEDVTFKSFFKHTEVHFTWLQKIEKSLKKHSLLNPHGVDYGNVRDKTLFSSARAWNGIEDDHKPFLKHRSDLPVLHLISSPFPRVWHTMEDNENTINYDVTDNFNRIFRVFVANYLNLPATTCQN